MAKTMLLARPGALRQILKAKNLTLIDFAKAWQFSPGTLRAIDKGLPVKSDTLAKAATQLRVPLDHLLPAQVAVEDVSVGETPVAGRKSPMERGTSGEDDRLNSDGLLVKAVEAANIELELEWIHRLTWTVHSKTPREAHTILRELGTALPAVATPYRRPDDEWGRLERQLENIEAWDAVKGLMARLVEEHGVHLLVGTYLHWSREEFRDPYENYVTAYGYRSDVTAHVFVAPTSVKSMRVYVSDGLKPPQFSPRRGPAVYVNDRELPREPVAPPANDDPPADTANDDDIPF